MEFNKQIKDLQLVINEQNFKDYVIRKDYKHLELEVMNFKEYKKDFKYNLAINVVDDMEQYFKQGNLTVDIGFKLEEYFERVGLDIN